MQLKSLTFDVVCSVGGCSCGCERGSESSVVPSVDLERRWWRALYCLVRQRRQPQREHGEFNLYAYRRREHRSAKPVVGGRPGSGTEGPQRQIHQQRRVGYVCTAVSPISIDVKNVFYVFYSRHVFHVF